MNKDHLLPRLKAGHSFFTKIVEPSGKWDAHQLQRALPAYMDLLAEYFEFEKMEANTTIPKVRKPLPKTSS